MKKIITSTMIKLFSSILYGILIICAISSEGFAQKEIPVDLLTGTANITIPLGSVTDKGINVPIALNYITTGVRVDEYEDWVGLGWSLNPGGIISREVRGLPDDYQGTGTDTRLGWLNDSITRQEVTNFDITAVDSTQWKAINTFYQNNKDTEPDLFYFSFGSGSGQFVFDKNGAIRLLSYTNLLIEFDGVDFTITDNAGVKYFFKTKETITKQASKTNFNDVIDVQLREYQMYKNALTYTSDWKLTKIESPQGGKVEFDYMNNSFEYDTPVEVIARAYNTANYVTNKLYSINYTKNNKLLEYIHSNENSAYFVHEFFNFPAISNEALPRKNHSYKLYRIDFSKIFEGNTLPLHTISFDYETIMSTTNSYGFTSAREFLTKVQTKNACEAFPPYEFEYNALSLPVHGSNQQDVWGYYTSNNSDQSHDIGSYLYPKTYIYPSLLPAQRYQYAPIPNQANEIIIEGNDRSATTAAEAGLLKKIHYPSGGNAALFYENNTYEETIGGQTITVNGPGVRVNKIVYEDGIPEAVLATPISTAAITNNYSYGKGRLIQKPNYAIPTAFYHDKTNNVEKTRNDLTAVFDESTAWDYMTLRTTQSLTAFGGVMYESASSFQTGQGKEINVYDIPAYYGIDSQDDWLATATAMVGKNTTDYGTLSSGQYAYPFPNNPNYSFERGKLKQKNLRSEDNKDVSSVDFTYTRLYKAADEYKIQGIYWDGVRAKPGSTDITFLYGKYELRTEIGTALSHTENKIFDLTNNTQFQTTTVDNTYGTGNHRLLQATTTTTTEGITNTTEYKYAKDYTIGATPTDTQSQMIKKLNDDNMGYRLVEKTLKQKYPGDTVKVVGGQLTLFNDFGDGIVRPHRQLLLEVGNGLSDFSASTISNGAFTYDNKYEVVSTIDAYNTYGAVVSATDNKKHKTGTHYGYDDHYAVVAISNTEAQNVIFSNFETATGHHFTYHTNRYLGNQTGGEAHTGDQSLELESNDVLFATLEKDGEGAVFTTWYKSDAAGTFTLTFKTTDGFTTLFSETINYNATNSEWQLLEKVVDVTSFPSSYSIELTKAANGVPVLLDDVGLLPTKADIITTTYDPIYGKTSTINARGITTYYSYDNWGRLKYVYDQDKNMVQANDYGFAKLENEDKLSADFTMDELAYHGMLTTFKASISECLSAPINYSWKIETDLDQNAATYTDIVQVGTITESTESTLPFTFNLDDAQLPQGENSRYFTVTLEVTFPGQLKKTKSKVIKVIRYTPPEISICAAGLMQIDICGIDADVITTCNHLTTPTTGTTFGLATQTGGNPSAVTEYQWQFRAVGSSVWLPLGLPTPTSQNFTYTDFSESFEVRYRFKETTQNPTQTVEVYSDTIAVTVYRSTISCAPVNNNSQLK